MVEIMRAEVGYIVFDAGDDNGVSIEADFDGVISWLRMQFNEPAQIQPLTSARDFVGTDLTTGMDHTIAVT